MSAAPQRERSDRPKVPRLLRKPCQNSHRATTIAIRLDTNKVSQSDAGARGLKIRTAPQRGRSNRGLRERSQNSHAPQREQSETHKVSRLLRGASHVKICNRHGDIRAPHVPPTI